MSSWPWISAVWRMVRCWAWPRRPPAPLISSRSQRPIPAAPALRKSRRWLMNDYSVGKLVADQTVHPGAREGRPQPHCHDRDAGSDQRVEGTGTGSGQGLAQAEQRPADDVAPAERLGLDADRLAGEGADLEALDQLNRDHPDQHGAQHEPVHVKGLEAEHLLDAKPRDGFGFGEHEAEPGSGQKIAQRLDAVHQRPRIWGSKIQVIKSPPAKKQQVATSEGHWRFDIPMIEWLEVQPPA